MLHFNRIGHFGGQCRIPAVTGYTPWLWKGGIRGKIGAHVLVKRFYSLFENKYKQRISHETQG